MRSREEILARAQERQERLEPVNVPEWGDEPVYVRVLGAKESLALTDGDATDLPFAILVATVCDADGNRLFQAGDEEQLANLPLREVSPLFREAAKLNGLTDEAVEEAVSRFGPTPGGATSTE